MVEVEQQMVAIDRVMNIAGMDVNAFRDDLIQLAYDYGNSFNNVADVSLRLAQAGVKGENNLKLTEKTLLALNTAELDATQATDDMVAVMSQWNLITDDATKTAESYGNIIDKVNKVADNFPTTSEDILEALKKTSSAFNLAGASIDETIATIVAAEKASQRGGKVIGTALSNITQQLKAEGKINLAEELGLDFFKDADKTEFKGIMEIFQEMAERMQELKDAGKENSVEMQNLLELFTVFRRNVGASLLGEMSGEDSTYLDVLKTSMDSVGYSIKENEKYMKTAKAAQEQFNNSLLKLKTEVWDNQLESVFRDMLSFGKDFVEGLTKLIDKVGILPTTVATATAAFSLFGKKIDANSLKKYTVNIENVRKELKLYNDIVGKGEATSEEFANTMGKNIPASTKKYISSLNGAKASMAGLTINTVKQIAKEITLNLVIAATEAAISMGLSVAITALVGVIDNWIHAEEKAIEKNKELIQTSQEDAEKLRTEREERQKLTKELEENINKYNELDKSDPERTEITAKLYELQNQINEALEGTGKQVSIINESLDEQGKTVVSINDEWEKQIQLLNQISYQDKVKEAKKLKETMEAANDNLKKPIDISGGVWLSKLWNQKEMAEAFVKSGISEKKSTIFGGVNDTSISPQFAEFYSSNVEKQIELLKEWKTKLEAVNDGDQNVADSLKMVDDALKDLNGRYESSTELTEKYNKILQELYGDTYRIEGYQSAIQSIMNTYKDDSGVQELGNAITKLNKDFADGKISADDYFNSLNEKIKNMKGVIFTESEDISQGMQAIFAETTQYIAEALDDAVHSYEEGTSTFAEYQDSLSKSSENLLELYGNLNRLTYDETTRTWFDSQTNAIDEYATSIQNATDTVSAYSDMLKDLGESYDYIAEHADAAGNANFQSAQVTDEAYQNLAANFANHLSKMREVNYNSWAAIVSTMENGSEYVANEQADVDSYVADALARNNYDLNAALNEANRQAQDSASKLGESTGGLLEALGNAISGFSYNITGEPYIEFSFGVHRDQDGMITGIDLPRFGYNITGTGGESVQNLGAALKTFGQDFSTYSVSQGNYQSLLNTISPYKSSNTNPFAGGSPSSSTPSSSGGGGGGGGSSGGSSRTSDTTSDTTKAEEEAYKERLNAFKAFISEKERLEKRWVDKQKELGLLSNQDYLYITEQRIERYKQYLEEVEKATWMSDEDRLALEKEYSEKIEDLQVDYLGYYKSKLDDDIAALKKANQEKIDLIKEEASERINALKKVEDENDRIRTKEEYEKRRLEHLEDISYWEQRTGREAQEALKEARKNLKELDEQWEQQMEDWS